MGIKVGLSVLWKDTDRLFENRVLRRILEAKREKLTAERRSLHYKDVYDLRFALSMIKVIKLRRIKWAKHVARI
jgi:choline kinase